MKGKHRKQLARRTSKRARDESHEIETAAVAGRPKRSKLRHLGRIHGTVPMARADRKTRRRAREFGGGTPPASNDNEEFGLKLNNALKNWKGGQYPGRKDNSPANTNTPPGDKED